MFKSKQKKKVVSFADDSDCSIIEEVPAAVVKDEKVLEQKPSLPPRNPPLPPRGPPLPPRKAEKDKNFWPNAFKSSSNGNGTVAKKSAFSWFTTAIYSIFKPKEKTVDLERGTSPIVQSSPTPMRNESLPRPVRSMGSLSRNNSLKRVSSLTRKRDSGFSDAKKVSVIDKDLCSLCAGMTTINSKLCPSCNGSGLSSAEKSIGQSLYLKFKRLSGTLFGWDPQPLTAEKPVDQSTLERANSLKERPPRSSLDPGPSSDWARNLNMQSVTRQKIASHRKREKGKKVIGLPVSNPHLKAIVQDVNAPSEIDFTDIVIRHGRKS